LSKIKKIAPDIILNAAAYNAVDKCEEDPQELKLAQSINGQAPGYLAEIALLVNAILVHYSSDYIFRGERKKGYTETDKPDPVSQYGQTKLMGETEILKLVNSGLKYYIIRASKLFGPKNVETSYGASQSKPSFFEIMLNLSKTKHELKIVNEEESCFTYTPDLAKATEKLINDKKDFGIYHITNSNSCTWYEAALELFKISKIKINTIPVSAQEFPRPAKRPKYSILLNTKLNPLRSYKEALEEYLELHKI